MSWLTDPFQQTFAQRALAEVLVLALALGPLGVWILLYRQSYAAESISHGMLPGLVVAALAGAPLVLGAAGGVVAAAGLIALAGRDERLGGDTGVAVAVSALFGLGALLAIAPETPARLNELLFGDLLGATRTDVAVAAGLAAAVVAALALAHRRLSVSGFDPGAARSLGATPLRTFLTVTVPLLRPGIVAGAFLAAVISLGEVAVSVLVAGAGEATVPVRIYSAVQVQLEPTVAAVSTLLLLVSVATIAVLDRTVHVSRFL